MPLLDAKTNLPTLVRFRFSFGGRLQRDGTKVFYDLDRARSARTRANKSESYLYRPERLRALRVEHEDRAVVRDYLEQNLDADLGLTDPARFHLAIRGITEFCLLGLHRYPEMGLPPGVRSALTPIEDALSAPAFFDESLREPLFLPSARRFLEHEFEPDLALSNPDAFRTLMVGIKEFLLRGLHRPSK